MLTGPNGSGKTSLLEAVGYLATAAVLPDGTTRVARPWRGRPGCPAGLAGRRRSASAHRGRDPPGRPVPGAAQPPARAVGRSWPRRCRWRVRARGPGSTARRSGGAAAAARRGVGGPSSRRDGVARRVRTRPAPARRSASSGRRPGVDRHRAHPGCVGRPPRCVGKRGARAREGLLTALRPLVERAYRRLTVGSDAAEAAVSLGYRGSWEGSLLEALRASRHADLRRGSTAWDRTMTSWRFVWPVVTPRNRRLRGSSGAWRWRSGWVSTSL